MNSRRATLNAGSTAPLHRSVLLQASLCTSGNLAWARWPQRKRRWKGLSRAEQQCRSMVHQEGFAAELNCSATPVHRRAQRIHSPGQAVCGCSNTTCGAGAQGSSATAAARRRSWAAGCRGWAWTPTPTRRLTPSAHPRGSWTARPGTASGRRTRTRRRVIPP